MTDHQGIVVTWNLFHGRDDPRPGGVDAKRSLLAEFAAFLDGMKWEVALLQEAPPRWLAPLGRLCRANGALGLTSRNELPWLRGLLGDLLPDVIGSAEGGSNMTFVRAPGRIEAIERHRLAWRPERRALLLIRLELPGGRRLAVANTHLSVSKTGKGQAELMRAAELARRFAGPCPLVLGGDLNLRPADHADAFDELERRFGLAAPTAPKAIDHLLARGLEVVEKPHALLHDSGSLRLSDHAPVAARFGVR